MTPAFCGALSFPVIEMLLNPEALHLFLTLHQTKTRGGDTPRVSKIPVASATRLSREFALANPPKFRFSFQPEGRQPILGFFLDPWLSALRLLGVWLYRQEWLRKSISIFH